MEASARVALIGGYLPREDTLLTLIKYFVGETGKWKHAIDVTKYFNTIYLSSRIAH